ncbi:CDP-archaeol synthase [Bradyrhizobium sp. CCBAU 53340]|uniref:CDP-archaeol synthase n=1 Tax=Bradyrhizobium sp. CCBAU 53340 TaxID=1325112 RepID=UPI00188C111A|nr:CDP-archaeol synthase [Bradyrhizobium sp. CCBAU 53340]QOZ47306.1 CDP-archaeol synthase [Bradyrhizobium sp. CCBAU 53340]
MQILPVFKLLTLLAVANGVPVLAKRLFGGRLACALDGGDRFIDGRPLFGASKTLRGLLLSIVVTTAVSPLLGLDFASAFLVGLGAMVGDLLSSFTKRRLGIKPSGRATGLDQVPESLLPALMCWKRLSLSTTDVVVVVAVFFLGEIVLSRLMFRLHIRDRPY